MASAVLETMGAEFPPPTYGPPDGVKSGRSVVAGSGDGRKKGHYRKAEKMELLRTVLRRWAQKLTWATSVKACGRVPVPLAQSVDLCVGDAGAFFRGLVRCGSAWECPVCMHAIAAGRAEEIKQLLVAHRGAKGSAYMLTLTLPHDEGDELGPMRRHVARSWQYVQSGAPWKRMKKKIGFFGSVRALEVTNGAAGWHPHLHVLVLTRTALPELLKKEFVEFVLARWRKAIAKPNKDNGKVYRAPSDEHGVTLTESHRDDYIAKLGLADELARGIEKGGHAGSRTPLQILHDIAVAAGTVAEQRRSVQLWMEYAQEMRGARQLTWSKGLQEAYSIPEQTELELAATEEREPYEQRHSFELDEWRKLIAPNLGLQRELKKAAVELDDPLAFRARIIQLLDAARGLPPVPF